MSKTAEFAKSLEEARYTFMLKHIWRHYKGGVYKITNFSIDTDTTEVRVEYQRIDGPDFDRDKEYNIWFSRPLREWLDDVNGEPRFVQVEQISCWVPVDA
jgi:hypothetical protein